MISTVSLITFSKKSSAILKENKEPPHQFHHAFHSRKLRSPRECKVRRRRMRTVSCSLEDSCWRTMDETPLSKRGGLKQKEKGKCGKWLESNSVLLMHKIWLTKWYCEISGVIYVQFCCHSKYSAWESNCQNQPTATPWEKHLSRVEGGLGVSCENFPLTKKSKGCCFNAKEKGGWFIQHPSLIAHEKHPSEDPGKIQAVFFFLH